MDKGEAVLAPDIDARTILSKTARGAAWTIGWRFASRGIGFFSTLVLVRLMTPEDFGIVSLAVGFFQMLDQVAGFGVEGAIIRANRVDRAIFDSAFTINVVRGLLTSAVLVASAGPAARFFGNPALVDVIYVLAGAWALSAFQNVGVVEFRRRLAFDMEFKLQLVPRLLAFAVTIPVALIWHDYWALIVGIVISKLASLCMSYAMHPYRPWFGLSGMKYIFGFSFWEWLIGLLNLVGYRADTMIIGRLVGAGAVGIYSVGNEIASMPISEMVAPLCRALFSGFVAERREGGSGAETMLRVLSMLAVLTFPVSVGLSLVAYPVIAIAFGPDWLGAVPLLQVLGVSATMVLFNAVGETLFSAHAWLRTLVGMTMVSTIVRLLLLVVLIPHFGLLGGALAGALMNLFQEVVYLVVIIRRLNVRIRMLLGSIARPAIAVAAMATALVASGLGWASTDGSDPAQLGIALAEAVALGAIVYTVVLSAQWLVAGRPSGAEADMISMIRRSLHRG